MNVPTMLRRSPTESGVGSHDGADVVTVRPVRAAFGPHVSLVSVDSQGRLWVRFSTAMVLMVAGFALMLIPVTALWWVSDGLVESGRVTLVETEDETATFTPATGQQQLPVTSTELPLAHTRER